MIDTTKIGAKYEDLANYSVFNVQNQIFQKI